MLKRTYLTNDFFDVSYFFYIFALWRKTCLKALNMT